MAGTGFTSQYTGTEIEQAIGAYLNGDTRSTIVVSIGSQDWQQKQSGSLIDGNYYIKIRCTGSAYVGNVPECFLVIWPTGEKIIPSVYYSANGSTQTTDIIVASNAQLNCDIVLIGSSPIKTSSDTVVVNPT